MDKTTKEKKKKRGTSFIYDRQSRLASSLVGVVNFFLYDDLAEQVFMEQPFRYVSQKKILKYGFKNSFSLETSYVCLLLHAIYG